MTRHVGRKKRWARLDAKTHFSDLGKVIYQNNGWFALLDYKTFEPPAGERGAATWEPHARRLGPFKRPRDAMVALEREATALKNRHGTRGVLFGGPVWTKA